jgi:peptidoglycan-associated lipoprotein
MPAENGDSAGYRFHWTGAEYSRKDLLGQVFFAFESASIGDEGERTIQAVATALQKNPAQRVTLIGYCDWYGTSDYNAVLGQKRADAVAAALLREGIGGERVQTQSRGSHDSPIGLSKRDARSDRRVDIINR